MLNLWSVSLGVLPQTKRVYIDIGNFYCGFRVITKSYRVLCRVLKIKNYSVLGGLYRARCIPMYFIRNRGFSHNAFYWSSRQTKCLILLSPKHDNALVPTGKTIVHGYNLSGFIYSLYGLSVKEENILINRDIFLILYLESPPRYNLYCSYLLKTKILRLKIAILSCYCNISIYYSGQSSRIRASFRLIFW